MRHRQNPIIFLINNGGYTIEVEIHDGVPDASPAFASSDIAVHHSLCAQQT